MNSICARCSAVKVEPGRLSDVSEKQSMLMPSGAPAEERYQLDTVLTLKIQTFTAKSNSNNSRVL